MRTKTRTRIIARGNLDIHGDRVRAQAYGGTAEALPEGDGVEVQLNGGLMLDSMSRYLDSIGADVEGVSSS